MKIGILRNFCRISVITLFVLGNQKLTQVLVGNLNSSKLFTLSLSDPLGVLEISLATLSISLSAIVGACIVAIFYAIVAPRAFCGWVCPVGILVEFSYFLKSKFFKKQRAIILLSKNFRYYFLFLILLFSLIFKVAIFMQISHVGIFSRAIFMLDASAFWIAGFIIFFEIFIFSRGICSYICPIGAFYAIISKFSILRVRHRQENCTKCMKCKAVCPESVLKFVGAKSFVVDSECISCFKCVEVCKDDALNISLLRRVK